MKIHRKVMANLGAYTLDQAAECLSVRTDTYRLLWNMVSAIEETNEYKEFKRNQSFEYGFMSFNMPTIEDVVNDLPEHVVQEFVEKMVYSKIEFYMIVG